MKRAAAVAITAAVVLLGPGVASAGKAKVKVKDDVFSPSSLTIAKQTKVKFVWMGEDEHDIVVQSGPQSFTAPLQTTGTFVKKFKKAGTYELLCSVHAPDMKMTVVVR